MAVGVSVKGIPALSLLCGFLVSLIGSSISPKYMVPGTSTVIFTIPSTLHFSMRVSTRTHWPSSRFSGNTEMLHLVMPLTFAITLEVLHGDTEELL